MMIGGPSTWTRSSPIETLVTRACEPSLHEPNYALHLEVAEYINQKKSNLPREAAMLIAKLANHRNPHVASLALSLLETLVQSCGYPFHLQISTKEFLNELVRRFPERPPPFPPPVMTRILDLIHGWNQTICVESRWKDDLGNIRDMHRLLSFKGYRFRDIGRQSANTSAATANLKSAEELEEEDRLAQSAKLQELIRRGTPRDLAAAQELMKALAGANPDSKPDYRTQSLNELNKLEHKVILLNEMLDNVDQSRGERFATGDAYDQVSSILMQARPKIQKWINDAQTDDPESLDTFLQINDQMNSVLLRYEAFKKGDYAAAANPIPSELNSNRKPDQSLSLIDLEDEPVPGNVALGSSGDNDLFALFAPPSTAPVNTTPAIGAHSGTVKPTSGYTHSPKPHFPGSNGSNSLFPQSTTTPPASIMLPATPSSGSRFTPASSGSLFTSANQIGDALNLNSSGFTPSRKPHQPQPQQQQPQQQPTKGKDPFADLAGLF